MEPLPDLPPPLPPAPPFSTTFNHAELAAWIARVYVPIQTACQRDMAVSMRRMATAMETLAGKLLKAGGG